MKLNLQLFGGRGARFGYSYKGNKYGSQYRTIFQDGNIKFIEGRVEKPETIFETMTKGRVYVVVNEYKRDSGENKKGDKKLKYIIYFDENNRKSKRIDFDKHDNRMKRAEHTHHGYEYNDKSKESKKGASDLSEKELKMVERVKKLWYNHFNS